MRATPKMNLLGRVRKLPRRALYITETQRQPDNNNSKKIKRQRNNNLGTLRAASCWGKGSSCGSSWELYHWQGYRNSSPRSLGFQDKEDSDLIPARTAWSSSSNRQAQWKQEIKSVSNLQEVLLWHRRTCTQPARNSTEEAWSHQVWNSAYQVKCLTWKLTSSSSLCSDAFKAH